MRVADGPAIFILPVRHPRHPAETFSAGGLENSQSRDTKVCPRLRYREAGGVV